MTRATTEKNKLRLTMIDVGWGDSIFLESIDSGGQSRHALVDCNDTVLSIVLYLPEALLREEEYCGAAGFDSL
jgi:hypothetical protein